MRCRITKALSSDLDLSQIDPGEYDCKPTTHFSRQNGNKPAFFLVVDGMPIKISQEKFNIAKEKGFLELLTEQKGGDEMSNLPIPNQEHNSQVPVVINFEDYAMTSATIRRQVNLIQDVMANVMKEGEHYGKIPGCGDKPSLLKPGAEKLSTTFRLAPFYEIEKERMENGHREYEIICTLKHIPSGQVIGQGVGQCSTMEAKYRYRKAEQKCPQCGKETIIKGKKEYGGGWVCFAKKGGCGAKFKDGDPSIENQDMGRVEHDNPADYYNTVKKMAKKRAHIDAVLTATAASDIFTQDVEDLAGNGVIDVVPEPAPQPKAEPTKQKTQKTTEPDDRPPFPKDMLKSKKEELFDKVMVAFGEENKKRKFAVKSADFINWLKEKNNCEFTISLAQEAIDNFDELRAAYDERDLPDGLS